MTETESPALAAYVPGKHEADALRFMNEWEPSSRVAGGGHIVAQKTGADAFQAFEWSAGRKVWRPWSGTQANAPRRVMVEALMERAAYANLTIMDEPVDFADYDGFTPLEFDHCVFCQAHTLLCPVGTPGGGDGWALVEVNHNGIGSPLSGGVGNPNRSEGGSFFFERDLAPRYRQAALPVEQAPLGYTAAKRVTPVLLRHDRVARQIVPKAGWGITGRPDLLARQTDRELAINAAVADEEERQRKSGAWLQPPEHLHHEVATRMHREWAAADARGDAP